jgi:hypothetical protein
MGLGEFIGIAGLVLTMAGYGWFKRGKYAMASARVLEDPLAFRLFGPASVFDHSPRMARVIPRHLVAKYEAEGFRIVHAAFGREIWCGRELVWSDGKQECVLMARPNGAPRHPAAPQATGPPRYQQISDIPDGVDPALVSYVRESKVGARQTVIDNSGREWRVRDPGGDLVLIWKRPR